jgi:hypothetical protein
MVEDISPGEEDLTDEDKAMTELPPAEEEEESSREEPKEEPVPPEEEEEPLEEESLDKRAKAKEAAHRVGREVSRVAGSAKRGTSRRLQAAGRGLEERGETFRSETLPNWGERLRGAAQRSREAIPRNTGRAARAAQSLPGDVWRGAGRLGRSLGEGTVAFFEAQAESAQERLSQAEESLTEVMEERDARMAHADRELEDLESELQEVIEETARKLAAELRAFNEKHRLRERIDAIHRDYESERTAVEVKYRNSVLHSEKAKSASLGELERAEERRDRRLWGGRVRRGPAQIWQDRCDKVLEKGNKFEEKERKKIEKEKDKVRKGLERTLDTLYNPAVAKATRKEDRCRGAARRARRRADFIGRFLGDREPTLLRRIEELGEDQREGGDRPRVFRRVILEDEEPGEREEEDWERYDAILEESAEEERAREDEEDAGSGGDQLLRRLGEVIPPVDEQGERASGDDGPEEPGEEPAEGADSTPQKKRLLPLQERAEKERVRVRRLQEALGRDRQEIVDAFERLRKRRWDLLEGEGKSVYATLSGAESIYRDLGTEELYVTAAMTEGLARVVGRENVRSVFGRRLVPTWGEGSFEYSPTPALWTEVRVGEEGFYLFPLVGTIEVGSLDGLGEGNHKLRYLEAGDPDHARRFLRWIEGHNGRLPTDGRLEPELEEIVVVMEKLAREILEEKENG